MELQNTMIHRHRGVLRFNILFSTLVLFRFFILVFHLKQKHEEGQRVLHYLQQTCSLSAMCKYVFVRNKETCQKYVKVVPSVFSEKSVELFIHM
jgi:uncharacterized protein YpiB (UPF0302 family)